MASEIMRTLSEHEVTARFFIVIISAIILCIIRAKGSMEFGNNRMFLMCKYGLVILAFECIICVLSMNILVSMLVPEEYQIISLCAIMVVWLRIWKKLIKGDLDKIFKMKGENHDE